MAYPTHVDPISDVDTIEPQPHPDMLPATMEVPEVKPSEKASHKLSSLANTAVVTAHSDDDVDPYKVFSENLLKSADELDSGAATTLMGSVIPQIAEDVPANEVNGVADALYKDVQTPGISDRTGFGIISPEPEKLEASSRMMKAIEEIKGQHEGVLDVGGEWAMTIFIPFRDRFVSKKLFDTYDLGKVENLVNTYRASTPEAQQEILDGFLDKAVETDDYWIEKLSFLDMFISNSADEDIALTRTFAMLDFAGALGDAAVAGKLAGYLASKSDVAKAVANAGNPDLAGKVVADAIIDPDVARASGVSTPDAVAGIVRNDGSYPTNEVLSNLPGAKMIDPNVSAFRRHMDEEVAEMRGMLLPETFNESDRLAGIDQLTQRTVSEIQASMAPNVQIQPQVRTLRSDSNGDIEIEVTYDYNDRFKKDGTVDKRYKAKQGTTTASMKLTATNWGMLDEFGKADVLNSGLNPLSPKRKLVSIDQSQTVGRTVEDAGLVTNATPKFENSFAEAYSFASKRAGGKKDRNIVNSLLSKQDETGKRMTTEDLLAHNPDLKAKHIESYHMMNELLDLAGTVQADMRFRRAELLGVQEVRLSDEVLGFGRSYGSTSDPNFLDAVDGTWLTRDNFGSHIMDASDGSMIARADIDNYLRAGDRRIAVLDKDEVLQNGGKHRVVIVPKDRVTPLRRSSLDIHRVDGYVPRIRTDAKYFIKEQYRDTINGVEVVRDRTFAATADRREAEALQAQRTTQIADHIASGARDKDLDGIESVSPVHYDREGFGIGSSDESPLDRGGLFVGHRATHDIQWRGAAAVLDPPDMAIAKNMAYLARSMPMNEWRMAIESRWKNSVRDAGVSRDPDIKQPLRADTPQASLLEEERKYIASMTGIPDEDALTWERMTRRLSELVDPVPGVGGAIGRSLRRGGSSDPITSLKYLAFQSMLGWFNPAQLFVQAMNMATAMSVHPWITAKHMHKAMALRAVLYTKEDSVIRTMASKIGIDKDELADTLTQFKRAGVDQVQTNADIDAASAGYGATRQGFQKVANAGLIFYRNGELAGRTVNYTVARNAYMRGRGIKSWKNLNDMDHRRIKEYFDNLSINLGKENKANFQRGLTSLPTQFWHVQTKFLEMFLGKKFTPAQKARLILGQGVLFGSAGIPFGNYMAQKWEGMYANEDGSSGNPIDSEMMRQGMLSFIAGDADLASRAGIPNAMTDQVLSIFEDTNEPLWSKLMGASGTLLGRAGYAVNVLSGFSPTTPDMAQEDALIRVLKASGSFFSSMNNAEQAYMMYKHDSFVSKTNGRLNYNNPTWGEIFSKSIGFQTVRERDLYRAVKTVKDREKWITKVTDQFYQIMFNSGKDVNSLEFSEEMEENLIAWSQYHAGGNEHDAEAIQKSVYNRLWKSEDKYIKSMAAALKQQMSDKIDPSIVTKAQGGN